MEKRFKFGWLGVLVVSLVFILLLSLGLVYQYGGLKYHFHATSFMKNLPADQKAAVEADFYPGWCFGG